MLQLVLRGYTLHRTYRSGLLRGLILQIQKWNQIKELQLNFDCPISRIIEKISSTYSEIKDLRLLLSDDNSEL